MRIALLFLLAFPSVALGQAGRFLLAAGEVTVVRGAQEIRAAAGAPVEAGDTIRVGPRSSVQLRMSDQQIISLRANTVFRIDDYAYSGGDSDRSIYSLLKGGMRTVSGAIARQQSEEFLRTSARRDAPADPQPALEEKKRETERKIVDLAKAPLRRVAGVLTPMRHAVRVPTATIGVRGTHYTVVHCDNDCFETRRTSVAAAALAQSDAGSPGLGSLVPNGTYGATSDGLIEVFNDRDEQQFGANSFFYVASAESPIHSLIAPPAFLYDRLEAQERNRGARPLESAATMARSGVNADSRPSETPVPPRLPAFVVTEVRTEAGAVAVVPGAPERPTPVPPPPVLAANTVFLSAFTHTAGGPDAVAAFVDPSALTVTDIGDGIVWLTAFNVPAGSTVKPVTGAYSGSATNVQNYAVPNAIGAYWGIWLDGSAADLRGTTTFSTSNIFHYLVAALTPPEILPKSGTFSFANVNGTPVTASDGSIGLFRSAPWSVDFGRGAVSSPGFDFVFPNQTWTMGGFSAQIQPSPANPPTGAMIDALTNGNCASGPCTAQARVTGGFVGPRHDHLATAISAKTGTASAQTIQIFSCAPNC